MQPYNKILIVDDDRAGQFTLAALLGDSTAQFYFAGNGLEALEMAHSLDPDLILLDVMMPGLDGFEVCRKIRAMPTVSEVPILLLTALDDEDSRLQGLQAGADDFISKPFNRAELRARVQTITRLNRHRRLHIEQDKFEKLFTLSPDGIMILDAHGTIQNANAAAEKFFASAAYTTLVGQTLETVFPAPVFTLLQKNLGQVLQQPTTSISSEISCRNHTAYEMFAEVTMAFFPRDENGGVQIIVRDITERKHAEQAVLLQLQRLQALNTIGTALNTNLDLRATLEIVLAQMIEQLHVDAASILMFDPVDRMLKAPHSRGFNNPQINTTQIALGTPYAGIAAQEHRSITIANLDEAQTAIADLAGEGFVSYHAIPLITTNELRGVLELMTRTPLTITPDWLGFAENLANQAAQALHTAALLADLQHSNLELTEAYDHTLAGWSRALDLRDKETRNHSQRVTEMSIAMARALGLNEEEVAQIRRGALLHDIGKMGVPDGILLKPGPLTEAERLVMNSHPGYAYELLSPIPFLRPALDIPYCHHEKWDGTGYPRGLRGTEIPLAARIFAIVDVWDALTSDRPYRKAWTTARALAFIAEQSNIHFDPEIVKTFMQMPWTQGDESALS